MELRMSLLLLSFALLEVASCMPVYEETSSGRDQATSLADEPSPSASPSGGSRYSGHLIALRPDYAFWNMVNVVKSMFDGRAERRVERALERILERRRAELGAEGAPRRRLVASLGRF